MKGCDGDQDGSEQKLNESLRSPLRTHGMQSIVRTDDRQQERIILSRLAAQRLAQFFKEVT